jgi:hypothetical protein
MKRKKSLEREKKLDEKKFVTERKNVLYLETRDLTKYFLPIIYHVTFEKVETISLQIFSARAFFIV